MYAKGEETPKYVDYVMVFDQNIADKNNTLYLASWLVPETTERRDQYLIHNINIQQKYLSKKQT